MGFTPPTSFRAGLAAAVLIWLGLRLLFLNGYYLEDAPGYVSDAAAVALGQYHVRPHVNGLNVGTFMPVALPLRLLGKSEAALVIWPMVSSLVGLLSMAVLCRRLFGTWPAIVAALFYAIHPGDVFFSTVVMPDAIQAGWLTLAIACVVAAGNAPEARREVLIAGGGLAMGICHLVRANDVTLLPVGVFAACCSAVWWRGAGWRAAARDAAGFLAGWAAVVIAEGVAYQWTTGDAWHRWRVVAGHYGAPSSIARMGLNVDPATIPFSLLPPLLWWRDGTWGRLNDEQSYHGVIFCWALLTLGAGAIALIRRPPIERRLRAGFLIAAAWLLWPVLYHQAGSQSLTAFVPMHRLSRHFVVYAPGAIAMTVAGVSVVAATLNARSWRRTGLLAVAVALVTVHVGFAWEGLALASANYRRIKDTYSRIRSRLPAGVTTVTADPGDLGIFDFWLNPLGFERVRMVAFAAQQTCEDIQGGVVLTYSNPGWERLAAPVIRETVDRLPCLIEPPGHWRLLYGGYPEKVFEVTRGEPDARQ